MSDDIKNIFQAVQHYESPVPAGDWDIISRRLQQRKKRKVMAVWLSAGAVAASVAAFFLLHAPLAVEQFPLPVIAPLAVIDDTPAPAGTQAPTVVAATPAETHAPVPTPVSAPPTVIAAIPAAETPLITPDSIKAIAEAPSLLLDSLFTFPLFDEPLPDKNKSVQKWTVALLAGQSSGAGMSADVNSGAYFEGNSLSSALSDNNHLQSTQHHLPLSAGITFRAYFTPHWAVESGLVYTYLASDYLFSGQAEIKQRLHYLGIPLNVVYQFFERKRFSLYVSGGGMVEKGLSAHYSYIGFPNKNTERQAIDGVQWSLSGQVGAGYNFYKQFSVYAEPGVRYFLPGNGQPLSIRTDRPFNFSVNIGLRINF